MQISPKLFISWNCRKVVSELYFITQILHQFHDGCWDPLIDVLAWRSSHTCNWSELRMFIVMHVRFYQWEVIANTHIVDTIDSCLFDTIYNRQHANDLASSTFPYSNTLWSYFHANILWTTGQINTGTSVLSQILFMWNKVKIQCWSKVSHIWCYEFSVNPLGEGD